MKKFTVVSLAALLVLALGATAYAQVKLDFRASGNIDAQTHYSKNVPPLQSGASAIFGSIPADYRTWDFTNGVHRATNRKIAYWDSRMSLRFEAAMGKELNGVLQFEIDSTRWGNSQGGIRPGSEAHAIGVWSTDRVGIEVKYMYFDVGLPYFGIPVPMNLRVGAQPLAIRPWFFQATDGVGVSAGIKIDPVNINPFYFKPGEGFDFDMGDDVDIYGVQANAKLGTFTLGGYFLYLNHGSFPLTDQPFSAAPPPGPYVNGTQKADFWWVGLYMDGKAGPFNIQLDGAFDRGVVRPAGYDRNVTYQGYAGLAKIEYPFEKFSFAVTGMYASGADADQTGATGVAGVSTANNARSARRVESWGVPTGSENGAANNQSAVFYGMEAGASGGQGYGASHNYNQPSKGAFGGTWFAKLAGSYKVTPWYKVTLQGLYIGDTTVSGNTYGTARKNPTQLRDDQFIGVELDMINEFEIYKNLTFKLFGGYMWAGNAMDLWNAGAGVNQNAQSPWAIRTRLLYTF